jgi:preprotein translocase subunit SecF
VRRAFDQLRAIAKGESNIDFMGRSRTWLFVSVAVMVISLFGLIVIRVHLSLEFQGGTAFQFPIQRAGVDSAEIKDELARVGVVNADAQIRTAASGSKQGFVRSEHIEDPATITNARGALAKVAGLSSVELVNLTDVGPTWGRQISTKMLRALIVFLILVVLYISLRFEPKMALGALAAVFHDLIATAGIYALVGFEVTPATVIALLTLLGYSLYDTVVVFDKVKENVPLVTSRAGMTYSDMVNRSVNQVLMRSINTSLTGLLPVGGLLFVGSLLLGAGTLKDLALALFIGTAVSTYSSVFVASPLFAWLKEREPRYRSVRARLTGGPGRERLPAGPLEPEPVGIGSPAGDGPRAPLRVPRQPPRGPRHRRRRGRRRR